MGEKCQWCALACAICRIGCFRCYQTVCCKEPSTPRPSYSVIAIGLSQAGKSMLFAKLSGDASEKLEPTVGFSVKAVQLPSAILNVKELGGGDNVRKYWPHYFGGAQGIVRTKYKWSLKLSQWGIFLCLYSLIWMQGNFEKVLQTFKNFQILKKMRMYSNLNVLLLI